MSKTTYDATATRDGRWWVVDVPEVGVTQGRNAAEARTMTIDLIASMLDITHESIELSLTFDIPGRRGDEVSKTRRATAEAALAQQEAAAQARRTVAALKTDGLSGADIAAVLGLSPNGFPSSRSARRRKIASNARRSPSGLASTGQMDTGSPKPGSSRRTSRQPTSPPRCRSALSGSPARAAIFPAAQPLVKSTGPRGSR